MTPSMKDVARTAGVSVTTVSRVLSNNGPVREALRRKVTAAVQQLGYRPNLAARRLRSRHSDTIGLIVSDVRNPFFTSVSRAVEDHAYQHGMRVILCNTDEDPAKEAIYLRLMQEERVSGVIFSPTLHTATHLACERFGFPVVCIDRKAPHGLGDAVLLDNQGAAERLVEHLIAGGYRRIAGMFGNASSTGIARHAGYRDTLARHGLAPQAEFATPTVEAAEHIASAWLQAPEPPQAILASNGLFLLGALKAIRRMGLRMPCDVALAGFDDDVWAALVEPGLTVIAQPIYEIGRTAMAMLMQRLDEPDLPARTVALGGELIVRGSTAPRPQR